MTGKDQIIGLACDHAGYILKEHIRKNLERSGYNLRDYGTFSQESVDYPDFIHPLAKDIDNGILKVGIITCGTGNGASMVANKYRKVRSAVCWSEEIAKFSRAHNNANILSLPARFIPEDVADNCVKTFLETEFEGGRHERRVNKISAVL